MGLAFGEHNNFREIPDEMLFGKRVKTTGEQAHLNEIERILGVRSATVVVGVLGDLINPPHRLLACLGSVGNLFPEHERVSKLRHYGVLNLFCKRAAS